MPWLDTLQDASWRGLPFAVDENEIERGRRLAMHEYPYRDTIWAEDLGRGRRTYSIAGFIIGDDVVYQRDAFLRAAEQEGAGELVHPSYGSVYVKLVRFSARERKDRGRVVELQFQFIESAGGPLFPTFDVATQDASTSAAAALAVPAATNFGTSLASAAQAGLVTVGRAAATAQAWVSTAQRLAGDASAVTRSVAALGGNFGRYSTGGLSAGISGITTVQQALSRVTAARSTVTRAASDLSSLVGDR